MQNHTFSKQPFFHVIIAVNPRGTSSTLHFVRRSHSMEKSLEKHLDDCCRMPGVTGAICVDQHGLCLSAKGNVSKYVSGPVAAIAHHAATLNGQTFSSPVIVIESQNGKMLIKQEEGFTTAIIKS